MRRRLAILAGAAAVAAAAAMHGCADGSHILSEQLERAPVIPKAPTARTTPIGDFDTPGAPFATPSGGYGAGGTGGLGVVRTDLGESSSASSLEDSDAVVCDPSGNRVILLKTRVRGTTATALVLASSSGGGALDGASGVYIAEPTVSTRRVIVSTSAGYAVMPETGAPVASHPVAGGPFSAVTVFETAHVLFLASGSTIRRQAFDTAGEFAPATGAVGELLYTGTAPITGLAQGLNGDLLVGEANVLVRIPAAGTVTVPAPVTLSGTTFATGSVVRGMCLNSANNAVVAIDRTGVGGGQVGAIFEVSLGTPGQAEGAAISSVTLAAVPRAVAIDGRHGAVTVAFATEVRALLEAAPDLDDRVQPIFNTRGCIGCHPVVNPVPVLTSAENSFNSMVNVAVSGSCSASGAGNIPPPAALYVDPGDPLNSLLIQKVKGKRDGSANAACGSRMPFGLRPIAQVEIDTLEGWITSGAAR